MASIGDTTRPAFAYDQATDTWVPVGIGPHSHTPSAVNSVSLDGGSTITVASGTTVPLTIQNNGTGNSFVVNDVASDTTPFAIMANGNVGVGTGTGPTTVSSGLAINDATAANYPGLEIQTAGTTRMYFNANNAASYIASVGTNPLATYTNGSERMRVDSSGNVGIGTASPTAKLDVNGSIKSDNLPGKNFMINGGLDIWQRGTTFASPSNAYTADRWAATPSAGTATWSVSQQTSFLAGSRYALRVQRTAGQTGTPALFLGSALETNDVTRLQGQSVTWSFYAKAGANYSAASGGLGVQLNSGTGIDQGPFVVHTGEVNLVNVTATLTTTATRYQYTFTVPSNATSLRWNLAFQTAGTAGAADSYDITNMQIEIGSVATPFTRAAGPTIQSELAACQRYYYLHSTGSGKGVAMGTYYSGSDMRAFVGLPVTMRTTPTLSAGSGTNYYRIISAGVSTDYFNSFTLEAGYAQTAIIQNSTEVSGTAGYSGIISCESGTNSFVAFSAEL
jgi:hypothetical protein